MDETLELAGEHHAADLEQLGHNDEPFAGVHNTAESDVFKAAEADHRALHEAVLLGVVACHLRGRLAHYHAGHDRHSRHVAANPELVFREVLVSDADHSFGIVHNDRRKLFHLEPLVVIAADILDVGNYRIEVVLGWIDDQRFSRHG